MKAASGGTMRFVLLAACTVLAKGECPFFAQTDGTSCKAGPGYQAGANTVFVEQKLMYLPSLTRSECTCENGVAAGRLCTGAEKAADDKCAEKESYKFASAAEVNAVQAGCNLEGCAWDASTSFNCPVAAQKCGKCFPGYTLVEGACTLNKCTCDGGTAEVDAACTTDGANLCAKCDDGYHHPDNNDKTCAINVCECDNGTNTEGAACGEHGQKMCTFNAGCNEGYGFSKKDAVDPSGGGDASGTDESGTCEINTCTCGGDGGSAQEFEGAQCVGKIGVSGNCGDKKTKPECNDQCVWAVCPAEAEKRKDFCGTCKKGFGRTEGGQCKQVVSYYFLEGDGGKEFVLDQAFISSTINKLHPSFADLTSGEGFGCAKGYEPSGFTYKIQEGETLFDLDEKAGEAVCVKATCSKKELDNVKVQALVQKEYKQEVDIECSVGYTTGATTGDSSKAKYKCDMNPDTRETAWKAIEGGECVAKTVSFKYHNGIECKTKEGKFGTVATMQCQPGYATQKVEDAAKTLVLGDNDWCSEKFCTVNYGDIEYQVEGKSNGKTPASPEGKVGARTGDVHEFKCDAGFKVAPEWTGVQTVVIDEPFGSWPGDKVVCKRLMCPKTEIKNANDANIRSLAYDIHTEPTTCKDGYDLNGSTVTYSCVLDGKGGVALKAVGSAGTAGGCVSKVELAAKAAEEEVAVKAAALSKKKEAKEEAAAFADEQDEFSVNKQVLIVGEGQITEQDMVAGLLPWHIILIVGGALGFFGCVIWFCLSKQENPMTKQGYQQHNQSEDIGESFDLRKSP